MSQKKHIKTQNMNKSEKEKNKMTTKIERLKDALTYLELSPQQIEDISLMVQNIYERK